MLYKTLLSVFLFLIDDATGNCGICQSNFVACHSESTFSLCIDDNPTDSILACPYGYICTDHPLVCVQPIDDIIPSCTSSCGGCGSHGNVFSCLSKTEFAFCFGKYAPFSDTRGSCLDGYVCDLNNSQICTSSAESNPTCNEDFIRTTLSSSTVETTTLAVSSSSVETTTLAPRDASAFCSDMAVSGTFAAEGDTTCTRYYICVLRNDVYSGYSYTCDSPNYFNSETKQCQKNLPDNC